MRSGISGSTCRPAPCRDGAGAVPLPSRAFDSLVYLVDHRDRLVRKNELIDAVWPDVVVTDDSLIHAISVLRRALCRRSELTPLRADRPSPRLSIHRAGPRHRRSRGAQCRRSCTALKRRAGRPLRPPASTTAGSLVGTPRCAARRRGRCGGRNLRARDRRTLEPRSSEPRGPSGERAASRAAVPAAARRGHDRVGRRAVAGRCVADLRGARRQRAGRPRCGCARCARRRSSVSRAPKVPSNPSGLPIPAGSVSSRTASSGPSTSATATCGGWRPSASAPPAELGHPTTRFSLRTGRRGCTRSALRARRRARCGARSDGARHRRRLAAVLTRRPPLPLSDREPRRCALGRLRRRHRHAPQRALARYGIARRFRAAAPPAARAARHAHCGGVRREHLAAHGPSDAVGARRVAAFARGRQHVLRRRRSHCLSSRHSPAAARVGGPRRRGAQRRCRCRP